jgi:membrane-bound serine protease (ClpP class)
MQTKVYRVKNLQTDKYEFFEDQQMPDDPNKYDLADKKLIVDDDEILTLTAPKALEYGVARAVVKDRAQALAYLEKRDGVTFTSEPMVLETLWSEELVRWLNSPAVMAVLVMIALLGAYIELTTPGVGLPGLVAVLCFAVIIGSKYLVGLANWVEVLIFVIGIILLFVEIFLLPGFGIAGVLGIIFIFAGVFGMLVRNPPDKFPWPQGTIGWNEFTSGVLSLCIGVIGFVVLAWLISKYLPRTQIEFLSRLFLVPTKAGQGGTMVVSMTSPTPNRTENIKAGDVGQVVSILRPTGKAKFGDAIVDVVAEAEFLDKGTHVEIIKIHGNRVVVKRRMTDDR